MSLEAAKAVAPTSSATPASRGASPPPAPAPVAEKVDKYVEKPVARLGAERQNRVTFEAGLAFLRRDSAKEECSSNPSTPSDCAWSMSGPIVTGTFGQIDDAGPTGNSRDYAVGVAVGWRVESARDLDKLKRLPVPTPGEVIDLKLSVTQRLGAGDAQPVTLVGPEVCISPTYGPFVHFCGGVAVPVSGEPIRGDVERNMQRLVGDHAPVWNARIQVGM